MRRYEHCKDSNDWQTFVSEEDMEELYALLDPFEPSDYADDFLYDPWVIGGVDQFLVYGLDDGQGIG